jgi:hygromycin-B 7''-O-kinase
MTERRCDVDVVVSRMYALPDLIDVETFHAWRADRSRWLPIAADIARGHSLPSSHLHVFSTGTNLVVALDRMLVLKIYPPMLRHQFVSERACLSQLHGRRASMGAVYSEADCRLSGAARTPGAAAQLSG